MRLDGVEPKPKLFLVKHSEAVEASRKIASCGRFGQAAEQRLPSAQLGLAAIYASSRNYIEAHMWFNLAPSASSSGELEEAMSCRRRVEHELTPFQLAEAQRLASEWDAAHTR